MNQIPAVFLHTSMQLVTGLTAGTIVDGVFPEPCGPIKSGDWKAFVVVGAEIAGQLIVDGLLTAAIIDVATKVSPALADPTMGATHSYVMMFSQPKLNKKVNTIGAYARDLFSRVLGNAPDEISVVKGAPHQRSFLSASQKQVNNAYI